MRSVAKLIHLFFLALVVVVSSWAPSFAADSQVAGVVVERSANQLTVRDHRGSETRVTVTPATEIKEKKKNFFRKATRYSSDQLLLGLNVQVKGRSGQDGILIADEISFTQDDLEVAESITSRVAPLESQLEETRSDLAGLQARLGDNQEQFEQVRRETEGQIGELEGAFQAVRNEAEGAQQTADQALEAAKTTNERIAQIDDYEVGDALTVQFDFDSTVLPDEAQASLRTLAQKYTAQRGYLFEIIGFASSEGNEDYNRRLSKERAEAVVRFLTQDESLPPRRIVTPHGYGENNPVADNTSSEGRERNRRVEIKVLVSRGLANR